jgi:hypothetical protein
MIDRIPSKYDPSNVAAPIVGIALIGFFLLLFLPSCTTAPLSGVADLFVEAETREERVVRINGFAAIAVNYAVNVTTISEAARVGDFISQLTVSLDRLETETIWVETEIQGIALLFAEKFKDRIDTSRFLGLFGGGIPSIRDMLDKLGNVASASAMLRDIRWVMKQIETGKMSEVEATAAFRKRIDQEAEAISRLVGSGA